MLDAERTAMHICVYRMTDMNVTLQLRASKGILIPLVTG